ncbi:MAG TPA: hypothetical protein VJ279_11210 [Hanamia sp.]|jgi:hypothetical protein|nr:hypothetical protein [Hanamia sp.]
MHEYFSIELYEQAQQNMLIARIILGVILGIMVKYGLDEIIKRNGTGRK